MTQINVFDDVAERLEQLADKHDMNVAELIELLLPQTDEEVDKIVEIYY